jgi:hypothetical protein
MSRILLFVWVLPFLGLFTFIPSVEKFGPSNGHALSPGKMTKLFESTPTWSDEFDYTGKPEPTKWDYDIGGRGWGNHELE